MMKRLSALLLVGVMLFALGACTKAGGNDGGPVGVTPEPAPNREQQEAKWDETHNADINVVDDDDEIHVKPVTGSDFVTSQTRVAELDADQLVITYMTENDWDTVVAGNETTPKGFAEAAAAWEATYGADAKINIRTVQLSEQNTVLAATVAGGESPDIVQMYDGSYPLWPSQGLTQSLLQYEENLDLYNSSLYDKNMMDQFRWNGHYYATIAQGAADEFRYYLIYNKKLFDDAGVKTPFEWYQEGKWNWTQFVKTAKEMTTGTSFGYTGWGLFPYTAPYKIADVVEQVGEVPTTEDEKNGYWPTMVQLTIDDPKYIRYMTEVYNLYNVDNAARNDWDLQNWRTMMPLNTDAMCMGSLGNMQNMVKTAIRKDNGADLRIAPVPVFDPTGETDPIPFTYALGNAISTSANAPVGAAEFIRLLTIVGLNQTAAEVAEGTNFLTSYFNDEEKEMMEWYKKLPGVMDPIKGVGNGYAICDGADFVYKIYYGNVDIEIGAIIDGIRPQLQAEIDDFNSRAVRVETPAANDDDVTE